MVVYNPQAVARRSIVEQLVALEDALNRTLQEAKAAGLEVELTQYQQPVVKATQTHIHVMPHD